MVHLVRQYLSGNALSSLTVFVLYLTVAVSVAPASAATGVDAENVTIYRAADRSVDGAAAIETGIGDGTIGSAERIVVGDVLVVAIDSERLATDLDAANGSVTERFFEVLDGDAEFRLVQTNMGTHSAPKVPPMGAENVTVYRNGSTTYALVDTSDLGYHRYLVDKDEYEPDQLRDGDQFAVEFGYDLDEVPFHGATYWEPAGPEVTLYTAESELPETATPTATETPTDTATATATVSASSETAVPSVSTTDGEGAGFTPVCVFAALFALVTGALYRR